MKTGLSTAHVRSFVFGVEDSLVSTVGLLSGIAAAGIAKPTIIVTGIVLIFVEAFSMAVGNFLSDQSANEYEAKKDLPIFDSAGSSITMFVSYFITGFIPLAPYFLADPPEALRLSIAVSLVALFVLGVVSSRFSKVNALKSGLQMFLIGGLATLLGVAVGLVIDGRVL